MNRGSSVSKVTCYGLEGLSSDVGRGGSPPCPKTLCGQNAGCKESYSSRVKCAVAWRWTLTEV